MMKRRMIKQFAGERISPKNGLFSSTGVNNGAVAA
jgi:hypothetical protein